MAGAGRAEWWSRMIGYDDNQLFTWTGWASRWSATKTSTFQLPRANGNEPGLGYDDHRSMVRLRRQALECVIQPHAGFADGMTS
jgi:hypothetical protein